MISYKTNKIFSAVNKPKSLLVVLWGVVQVVLFFGLDINDTLEAKKYIGAANALETDGVFDIKYLFYATYVLFIFFLKNPFLIVLVQVFLNGIAMLQLRKLTQHFGGKGNVAALLFITSYIIQVWNFALYTESLFISLLIILSGMIVSKKHWVWVLVVGAFTFFCRPTFILFLPALLFLYLSVNKLNKRWLLLVMLIIPLILYSRLKYFDEYFSYFIDDQIICELLVVENLSNMELVFNKIWMFFLGYRSHYSTTHNVYLVGHASLYVLVVYSFIKNKVSNMMFFYLLLGVQILFVSFTCVNWNNRFLAVLLPFMYVMTELGIKELKERNVRPD